MRKSEKLEIPPPWKDSAKAILENRWRKILIVGATDRGKSTYCYYLCQMLIGEGFGVAVIDADVGQKDIGPPATITLGYPEFGIPLDETPPTAYYFVGSVTPEGHLLPMLVGTKRLLDAAKAPFVIINTTGLIHEVGRVLKGYKIDLLKPDIIVAIEKGNELKSLIRSYRNKRIIRISPSLKAVAKGFDKRKSRRERAFKKYFQASRELTFSIKKLIFQRSLLFSGKRIKNPEAVYSEITSEGIVTVTGKETVPKVGNKIVTLGFEKNLLCGVAGWKNGCLGLAIIQEIDFDNEKICLLTPVDKERIRVIQLGDLYLHRDGKEIRRKSPDEC